MAWCRQATGHYLSQCWPRSQLPYGVNRPQWVNLFAPGRFEWNLVEVIFKIISVIDGWGISFEIALIWMSLDFTDDQSTLVQVMAWCRQAASHYLGQCWPRSQSPYGVTRPQWVNSLAPGIFKWNFVEIILKIISVIHGWGISFEIALRWMPLDIYSWEVNIGLGNGLVPSGNKPLPEPMLTQISVAIWRHEATMS